MLKDKCIVCVIALVASLPVLVNYNIVGEELIWYLLKAEALLGVSVDSIYRLFVAVVNLATAGITYLSFRKAFQSSIFGVLACALYTLAPSRLHLIYIRCGVGAYLVWMFLPLILMGAVGFLKVVGLRQKILNSLLLVLGLLGTVLSCVLEWAARKENVITEMTFQTIGVDSSLLLCLLLWFALFLKQDKRTFSKEQGKENQLANISLLTGVVLLVVSWELAAAATLCLIVTAVMMGKRLMQEEKPVFPSEIVIYTLVVVALIFGTYEVNDLLMNSGNLMFI